MQADGAWQPDRIAAPGRSVILSANKSEVPMNINVTASMPTSDGTSPEFEVERLGASLGAEIHGLDLKAGLNTETFKAFEAALIEHKVLVLRDQHLNTEQHVAISR